jgi:hypothetical protein
LRRLPQIEVGENFLAGLIAELEAPSHPGVVFACSALCARLDKNPLGFAMQALEQFHQIVDGHRQREGLATLAGCPADVLQQAEVFAELQAEPLGGGEVLVLLQRDPDVADSPRWFRTTS